MQIEYSKLTDSLERELSEREVEGLRVITFAGLARGSLRRLRQGAGMLGAAIRLLRRQARDAKVDYVAG